MADPDDAHEPVTEQDLSALFGRACDADADPVDICRLVTECRRLRTELATARAEEREAAALIADAYATELVRMAGDTVLHDPILHGGDISVAAVKKSDRLTIEGAQHSASHHTALNIASAIRARTS